MSNSNFEWNEPITCQFTKEQLCEDKLKRTKYANYLSNYLNSFKNESYVFNLNSEWGSGKTYFIKRWANSIADKHPVVYIDAWRNDNHSDPLLLVLSAVINRLQELLAGLNDDEKVDKQARKQSLISKSTAVIKASAPLIVKGFVKKVSGVDIDELSDANNESPADTESSNDKPTETGKSIADAMSKATEELLKTNDNRQQAIEGLRQEIEKLLDEVICKQADGEFIDKWSPMYIFIDELDRCRPTFAIELLEVVKHIFDIKKVIFVIATDTGQLQHSIRAVYGEGFDSPRYLMRFFERTFALPQPSMESFIKEHSAFEYLTTRLIKSPATNRQDLILDKHSEALFIFHIFKCSGCDLRTINQILERTKSVLAANKDEYGVIILILLDCLRTMIPNAYQKLVTNPKIEWDNLELLLKDKFEQQISWAFPKCSLTDESRAYKFSVMIKETITVLGKLSTMGLAQKGESKLSRYLRYVENDYTHVHSYIPNRDIEVLRMAEQRFNKYTNFIELASNLT